MNPGEKIFAPHSLIKGNKYRFINYPNKPQQLHTLYPGKLMSNQWGYTGSNIPHEDPEGLQNTVFELDKVENENEIQNAKIADYLGGGHPPHPSPLEPGFPEPHEWHHPKNRDIVNHDDLLIGDTNRAQVGYIGGGSSHGGLLGDTQRNQDLDNNQHDDLTLKMNNNDNFNSPQNVEFFEPSSEPVVFREEPNGVGLDRISTHYWIIIVVVIIVILLSIGIIFAIHEINKHKKH